jgi:hypothetical protein
MNADRFVMSKVPPFTLELSQEFLQLQVESPPVLGSPPTKFGCPALVAKAMGGSVVTAMRHWIEQCASEFFIPAALKFGNK